jgi:hypothetical protein
MSVSNIHLFTAKTKKLLSYSGGRDQEDGVGNSPRQIKSITALSQKNPSQKSGKSTYIANVRL